MTKLRFIFAISCALTMADVAHAQAKKKTVAELLAQARQESRGGNERLEKGDTAIPQSQVEFAQEKSKYDLNSVKPPRSSELMKSDVDGDKARLVKVLDQQIAELYKLSQKFKGSANRGEMWLRLAELYVEKATILDSLAQDEFDKKLKLFQEGRTRTKPTLDQSEAREYNRKAVQLYEWFVKDFPRDEKIGQAYFFLGFNFFELGQTTKAVDYYEKLIDRHPNSPFLQETYFALGEYYFENEKWTQAYKNYSPLLKDKRHRLHTFALYKSAWCLYRLGKNADALKYLETIIKSGRQETGDSLAGRRTVNRSKLEAEALRDIVAFYAAAGRAENAASYFRNLVGGDVTPYLERLAYYHSEKGNRDAAENVFKQLISQSPNSPKAFEYQYQIVQNYFYAKNSQKFQDELYRWITDYGPETNWARANSSNTELIANSQKLRETTLRNWTLQQHQTAQNSRAAFAQGLALQGYKLYLEQFSQPQNLNQAADMRFYYGELLYDMKRYTEAGSQYQWVVENAPQSKFGDKAATNLILSVEKGLPDEKEFARKVGQSIEPIPIDQRSEKFIQAGRWYINKFPQSEKVPEIQFRIGRLYYQHNQFDPAASEFKSIVKTYPRTKYAEYSANLLLDIFNLKKDYVGLEQTGSELLAMPSIANTKAGSDIRGVLEKASFKKAQDLEGEKKYSESALQFEVFAQQNPKSDLAAAALFNSAVNYERAGQVANAQTSYEKVLRSNDKNAEQFKPRSRRLLAKLMQESGQLEEAARLYRSAALDNTKDPLAANMLYNSALIYQSVGRTDEALKSYDDFIKIGKKASDLSEARYQMAVLYEKAGQRTQALRSYEEYLATNPSNSEQVIEAMGKIYVAQKNTRQEPELRDRLLATSRRFSQNNRKFDPQWPAKAKLSEADEVYAELRAITFPKDQAKLKKALEKKAEVLNRLTKVTADVVRFNSAPEIIDALNLNGRAYEHMATSLKNAPLPSGLSAEEEKLYRQGVEKQFVEPNLNKAKEFHEKAVQRAWELETYNKSYRSSLDYMNKLDPKTYYSNGEQSIDVRYMNWMTQ